MDSERVVHGHGEEGGLKVVAMLKEGLPLKTSELKQKQRKPHKWGSVKELDRARLSIHQIVHHGENPVIHIRIGHKARSSDGGADLAEARRVVEKMATDPEYLASVMNGLKIEKKYRELVTRRRSRERRREHATEVQAAAAADSTTHRRDSVNECCCAGGCGRVYTSSVSCFDCDGQHVGSPQNYGKWRFSSIPANEIPEPEKEKQVFPPCTACGKRVDETRKYCAKCNAAIYCSEECRKKDEVNHARFCSPVEKIHIDNKAMADQSMKIEGSDKNVQIDVAPKFGPEDAKALYLRSKTESKDTVNQCRSDEVSAPHLVDVRTVTVPAAYSLDTGEIVYESSELEVSCDSSTGDMFVGSGKGGGGGRAGGGGGGGRMGGGGGGRMGGGSGGRSTFGGRSASSTFRGRSPSPTLRTTSMRSTSPVRRTMSGKIGRSPSPTLRTTSMRSTSPVRRTTSGRMGRSPSPTRRGSSARGHSPPSTRMGRRSVSPHGRGRRMMHPGRYGSIGPGGRWYGNYYGYRGWYLPRYGLYHNLGPWAYASSYLWSWYPFYYDYPYYHRRHYYDPNLYTDYYPYTASVYEPEYDLFPATLEPPPHHKSQDWPAWWAKFMDNAASLGLVKPFGGDWSRVVWVKPSYGIHDFYWIPPHIYPFLISRWGSSPASEGEFAN